MGRSGPRAEPAPWTLEPYIRAKYVIFITMPRSERFQTRSSSPRFSVNTMKKSLPGRWMKLKRTLVENAFSRLLYYTSTLVNSRVE